MHSFFKKIAAGSAVFALAGGPSLAHAASLITDGNDPLFDYSFTEENTSWRITTTSDSATVEEIESDFVGESDQHLTDDSGWSSIFSGDDDDRSLAVDLGYSLSFGGEAYDTAFISSNTYISFHEGSELYWDLREDRPALPSIHLCSGDHSYQEVYQENGEGFTRIRYEGTDDTDAGEDSPNIIYEVVFYAGENYIDVHMGTNAACDGEDGSTLPYFHGYAAVGQTLHGNEGNFPASGAPYEYQYQWQRGFEGEFEDIEDATQLHYTITEEDIGASLRLTVTGITLDDEEIMHISDPSDDVQEINIISSCAELFAIDETHDSGDAFALTGNIDCDGVETHPLWYSGESGENFTGLFDGKNYTIENLSLSSLGQGGLFYQIADDAVITNINFTDSTISGEGDYLGTLSGYMTGGTITNITIDGSVDNTGGYTGGLIGNITTGESSYPVIISNVYFTGSVHGDGSYTGGIAGSLYSGDAMELVDISHLTVDADISGSSDYVGGIAGQASTDDGQIDISTSSVQGSVVGDYDYVGGIVGFASAWSGITGTIVRIEMNDVYTSANISGVATVGGIVGSAIIGLSEGSDTEINIRI